MIGGGQMRIEIEENSGADAYVKDAMAGVPFAKQWLERKQDEREMDRS